jgi:hypothetical protein
LRRFKRVRVSLESEVEYFINGKGGRGSNRHLLKKPFHRESEDHLASR